MAKKTPKATKAPKATETPDAREFTATAEATTKKSKAQTMTKTAKRPAKISALDAAAKVLGEVRGSMTTGELIEAMAKNGYWSSPGGQTPAATLYAAIAREINVKGKEARFTKTERGKFALKA